MAIQLSGNETLSQLFDALQGNKNKIYTEMVTVMADGARYEGRIVARGNNYLVLETDLRRQAMGDDGGPILARTVIDTRHISAIYFEYIGKN